MNVPIAFDVVALLEPVKVISSVANHFFGKVGAIDGETLEGGLLEDCAGATEGVEDGDITPVTTVNFSNYVTDCKVDHDLSEFRREHTDKGVAFGAVAVADGVGGDILDTTPFGDNNSSVVSFDDD